MEFVVGLIPVSVRIFFSTHYWTKQFSFGRFMKSFFAVCGMGAAAAEAGKKLVDLFKDPGQTNWLTVFLDTHHWGVILTISGVAVIAAMIILKPTTKVTALLKKRDLNISIEVGDLLATNYTLIIGTNTTFDTAIGSPGISQDSLQGKFTKRYYGTSVQHLDTDLDASLRSVACKELSVIEKGMGKRMQYEMGSVAKINAHGRDAYFVAMARMNGNLVASTTIEDVRTALSSLWLYISEKGGGLPRLRVPILGTGFGKLVETREEVVKEILRSLVAACTSDRFCDQFTVVISVKDFVEYKIDLIELGEFLKYLTTYTELRSVSDVGSGVAVGA